MKNLNLTTVSRTCVSVLLAAALLSCNGNNGNDPKIGDIWRYTTKLSNRETSKLMEFYDFKVIDVNDGYVFYMMLPDSTKFSSTIRMFKVGAECISGCR